MLDGLRERYGDRLVPLIYHNRDEMKTDAGTEFIGYIKPAHPQAAIDRVQYPETTKIPISRGDWGRTVQYRMEARTNFTLELEPKYNTSTREVSVSVNVSARGKAEGSYRINVIVTEDHLKYKQKYYRKPYKEIEEYYHSHVVRDMITGAFGEPFKIDAENGNAKLPFTFKLKPEFVDSNCNVVVFVHRDDGEGFGAVMQADMFSLKYLMPAEGNQ